METAFLQFFQCLDHALNFYTNPHHRQFCADMFNAGQPVLHYEGKYYWSGPAVKVKSIDEVLTLTKVSCIWDKLGDFFVVYPTTYCEESLKKLRKNLKEALWQDISISYRQGEPYKSLAASCFSAALYLSCTHAL
jgi:hypothetical protein